MCQSRTYCQPLQSPTPDLGLKAEEESSSTHAGQVFASASCDLYYINEESILKNTNVSWYHIPFRNSTRSFLCPVTFDDISMIKSSDHSSILYPSGHCRIINTHEIFLY